MNGDDSDFSNDERIFLIRGLSSGRFALSICLYGLLTFFALIFVIGKYPYQPNDSIGEFLFVLLMFLGMCYLDIHAILSFISKIEGYRDRFVITNLFLQKRIIPYSTIERITPNFLIYRQYFTKIINGVSCKFNLKLTDGQTIKFNAYGNEYLPELVNAITEEVSKVRHLSNN